MVFHCRHVFRCSDDRVLAVVRLHRQGDIDSHSMNISDRLTSKIQETFLTVPVVGIGHRIMEWMSPPHHFPFDLTGKQLCSSSSSIIETNSAVVSACVQTI